MPDRTFDGSAEVPRSDGESPGRLVTLGEVVADVYRDGEPRGGGMGLVARPGGAPANAAIAASRLGSAAAFLGAIGEDLFGDYILETLVREGVSVRHLSRPESRLRTTIAFVEITASGDRSFTFYRTDPAADESLSPEHIPDEAIAGAGALCFGSIPLIREPSRSAVHHAARVARGLGVPVALDVNLRPRLWSSLEEARGQIYPLLELCTVVKLSDDELEPLLGTSEPDEAADELLGLGIPLVLITSGPEGAMYATSRFRDRVPTFVVDVVDPTGAGDAFFAGTLSRLLERASEGEPLESKIHDEALLADAVLRGCAAGALVCTGHGALSSLPDREKLESFLARRKPAATDEVSGRGPERGGKR